jgi:hypothetical protein
MAQGLNRGKSVLNGTLPVQRLKRARERLQLQVRMLAIKTLYPRVVLTLKATLKSKVGL